MFINGKLMLLKYTCQYLFLAFIFLCYHLLNALHERSRDEDGILDINGGNDIISISGDYLSNSPNSQSCNLPDDRVGGGSVFGAGALGPMIDPKDRVLVQR